jgi:protein ImuB
MFAAIYVPDFPVEAVVRAEPELREQAVAVVEGTPPLVRVVAVNERAAQAGVEPGMTRLQAEERLASGQWPVGCDQKNREQASGGEPSTLSRPKERRDKGGAAAWKSSVASAGEGARGVSGLGHIKSSPGGAPGPTKNPGYTQATPAQGTVRERSREREAAAHAALLDCGCGFSPRVEDTAADTLVLDLAGLERVFGPPAKIVRDVARRCSEMGLEANVAVASNADTAVLAARGFAGVTVIAEGKEAERLGELSVEVLLDSKWSVASGQRPANPTALEGERAPAAGEILETLERWGVRNLRALAALPEVALVERLGQEGLRWQKLARGETQRPLVVAEPPLLFEEAAELEYPVETLEPLAFLLNRMLEQLCARLAARALATNQLTVRLDLEVERDCGTAELRSCGIENNIESNSIPQFGNPSIHQRTLRLPVPMLDARVFLKLLQLDLQAHPPQAAVTKVWLRAEPAEPRRAQNGLFVPEAPEAEKLSVTLARIGRVVSGQWSVASGRDPNERVGSPEIADTHRGDAFRMKAFAASGQWPAASGQHALAGERAPTAMVALRVFRPALAAVVTVREGKPAQVASAERPAMRGEVVWCAGPWRSAGEWWTEQAWRRQEWDVAVRNEEGVALYRIYRDEIGGRWWMEGTYD